MVDQVSHFDYLGDNKIKTSCEVCWESWTLLNNDVYNLIVFERRIVRKIFRPVKEGEECFIRKKIGNWKN